MDTTALERLADDDRFVRRLALKLSPSRASADDLAQEAWLAALGGEADSTRSRGWFATVLRRLALNAQRGAGRRSRRERRAARPEAADPEAAFVEREEVRRALVEAVRALGPPVSTVLVLRWFENLPPRAIARRLGMPVETVRTHLKRGLERLRERLAQRADRHGRPLLLALPLLRRMEWAWSPLGALTMAAKLKLIAGAGAAALALVVWWAAGREPGTPPPPEPAGIRVARAVEAAPPTTTPADAPAAPGAIGTTPFRDADPPEPPQPRAAEAPERGSIRGRVLRADGAPAAGVAIRGAPAQDPSIDETHRLRVLMGDARDREPSARTFEGVSADDGGFELRDIVPDEAYGVAASHPDCGVVIRAGVPVRAGETAEVVLRFDDAVVLYGTVLDGEGRPVPGARLSVMGSRDEQSWSSFLDVVVKPDGSFRTAPLARKGFELQAYAGGFVTLHHRVRRPDGQHGIREDLVLERAPKLGGRIVGDDGRPAKLREVLEEHGAIPRSALSLCGSPDDPATAVNFLELGHDMGSVDLDADTWTLVAQSGSPRYVSLWVERILLGSAATAGGLQHDLVVHPERLPPPPKRSDVTVRVVTAQGAPVDDPAAKLHPVFHAGRGTRRFVLGFAAVEGRPGTLRAPDILPGDYELRVRAAGFAARRIPVRVDPAAPPDDIVAVLEPADGGIDVIVRDESGSPIEGARVCVLDAAGRPVDGVGVPATTNAEGRVTVSGLGTAEHHVFAARDGSAPDGARVSPSAGERRNVALVLRAGVQVELRPEGAFGPFSFRIADAMGRIVFEDACVDTRRFGNGLSVKLAPGRYVALVHCPGFRASEAAFDAAEGAVVPMKLEADAR